MPKVGKKHYPYTKKGRKDAAAAKNKNGKGRKGTKVAKRQKSGKKKA